MVLLARVRPLFVPRFLIVLPPEHDHPLDLNADLADVAADRAELHGEVSQVSAVRCESRLVRPYAGRSIPCGARRNTVCDAYGHQVGLAALPGAQFTDCHDAIAHELWRILMKAGVHVGVEPRGSFTTLIPTQVRLQPGPTPGAVPDAAIDVAMAAPAIAPTSVRAHAVASRR